MRLWAGAIIGRTSEWALYRAGDLSAPDTSDLEIRILGPGGPVRADERQFLRRHMRASSLWYMMRWQRRGKGWVFFARVAEEWAYYAFVTPARRYRREFPLIAEPRALLIGPCLTEEAFRGRSIYPRMLQYAVNWLSEHGHGPFYIHTNTTNGASIRGMEKAGFTPCGVWAVRRSLLNLIVTSRRIKG